MILPKLDDASRLRGLYIYDFGEWTAVGYTAEEIAILLEQETYRGGKIYRIHRAQPNGQMELRGVSAERFGLESGMFFYRNDLEAARADYEALRIAARNTQPPCRAFLHLVDRSAEAAPRRYVVALIFPAEYESDIGRWLSAIEYAGGGLVEGGISHVGNYYQEQYTILERQQLWSHPAIPSRSPEQVLATVRQAVQR
jgi:hypothetical protein